ncbi:short-subunit dehydrogenase [Deinobacterium chartae]|uniref:Short-subunit dehydrogenase n=1 Tax=Deinobacterium chartae TaxID=521158 RepID=A0A841I4V3_9DEIO|nr:SDR family NAD(P)-dependent oxidoreductase [Deinobacterium chartae]MBB6098992.1 short-subunit dehydrogenase [Deinobacterium chartae]
MARSATLLLTALGLGTLWALRRTGSRYDLRGKVVLIAGGSRGLGLVLARELARRGARLVLSARDPQTLERAAEELRSRGAEVYAQAYDLSDPEQAAALVQAAGAHFGRIDVLINNAGVIQVGPFETMQLCDYDEAMRTHFWAPLHLIRAVLPGMRSRREGRIVNISSIGGKVSVPHLLPYSASKFALTGFSQGLRAELKQEGILVTTVCPGLIRSGSTPHVFVRGRHQAEYAWFSVADSLPVLSASAEATARDIVRALEAGQAELITSLPGKALAAAHGLFPGRVSDLLAMTNRLLPRASGYDLERRTGAESESAVTRSALTALSRKAAAANNEGPAR